MYYSKNEYLDFINNSNLSILFTRYEKLDKLEIERRVWKKIVILLY